MKYILITFFLVFTTQAQDIQRHRDITNALNSYLSASASTTPNKALVYVSNRDFTDRIDWGVVFLNDTDLSNQQIEITRITPAQLNYQDFSLVTLTECEADYGTVTILPTRLIVRTHRLPVNVTCWGNNKQHRENYQTIFEP